MTARMEVALARTSIIVIPHNLGSCMCCKRDLIMEVHLRVADDFELGDEVADHGESVPVDMRPVGVRVAHDCVPGPTPRSTS